VSAVCIVPARGGSKGIPRKNLRPVGGVPLVARSILAARAAERVDSVIVSTDDAEIAAVAQAHGARAVMRPEALSTDTASSEAALLHVLDVLAGEGEHPELVVFLQCTSPFTTAAEIDRCVAALDDPRAAAAVSVMADHGFLWTTGPDGFAIGVNHVWTEPRKRRQDLPPQFRETGSIYVMRTAAFLERRTRFCGPVVAVPIDVPCAEIDSPLDLEVAEAVARHAGEGAAASRGGGPVGAIRALVMDFDGVHTDDRVTVGVEGDEYVACSRSDGMGVEMLRKRGLHLLILSKEVSSVVAARGRKLKVEVRHGIEDKLPEMKQWLAEKGVPLAEACYIGNDVNDADCLRAAGLAVVPADAHPDVVALAHIVTTRRGGRGALRELAELLMAARTVADAG
jgi:YrbI family 3-deoxy-D-manno-octulosonate 8-phosphate phosphatase